ncbi:DNA topoisomerase [Tulasnella sp. JGI-2019a]|nr:DNA topoisomerase [Tulasnella sp. JGI-2019a]
MRVLCVAEKPSIAKAISQILSGGQYQSSNTGNQYIKNYEFDYPQLNAQFIVTSVSGHLFTYDFGPQYRNWNSCDPFILFDEPVDRKVAEGKSPIETNLKTQARRSAQLMIWTDCDREGENIGAEVASVCRGAKPQIIVKRARFSAIIAGQIHHAAQHPVELDMAQAAAVDARSILDLRLGAVFTRMQTLALQRQIAQLADQKLISYGPCQFPTLGFVVSRYEQVQSFVPEPFWYIYLSLAHDARDERRQTEFTWERGKLFEFDVALALYEWVMEEPTARVTKVTKKNVKKWKPLPLTTVELQKSGSRLLRMTPKKILDLAEKLYQHGFLSYPRTETDQFDPQFDHMALIAKQAVDPAWGQFATGLQQGGFSAPRRGQKNDQAHPPIHPTAHAGNVVGDEKRVYEFVTRRYLACCSKDAEGFQTTVEVVAGGEQFKASGLAVLARNYLDVYPYDTWGDRAIPDFQEGQEFMPSVVELKDGQTSRPNLLTEADLVGLMDKNGIGTDATIAQHIQTITDREYVVARKEGAVTYLVPSTLGIGLVEGYNRIGFDRSLSKPQLRRETERMMVQVCEGTRTKNQMIDESIEQYKHVFILARNQFNTIVNTVRRYVSGEAGGPGGGGDDGSDDEGPGPGGGGRGRGGQGGRGGRGEPRGRGRGAGRGRGRGAGGGAPRGPPGPPDDDDDEDFFAPPPRPAPRAPVAAAVRRPPSAPVPRSTMASDRQPPVRPSTGVDPTCECGDPSVERIVNRDTANKGKRYRTCPSSTCTFFEWVTDSPAAAVPAKRGADQAISGPAKRAASGRLIAALDTDATRRCKCELTAVSRTVNKEGPNQGRTFWTCPNSENARCGFFEWDDGVGNTNAVASGSRPYRGAESGATGLGSNACFKCGESGHFANACPNNGTQGRSQTLVASSGGGDRACFKCGEEGHFSNVCLNGDKGSGRTNSRSDGTSGGGGSGGGKSGECFKCGKSGHWSNDCPNPTASSSRGRGKSSSTFTKSKRGGRGRGGSSTARGSKKKSNFGAVDEY